MRIPPFFVKGLANWPSICILLKAIAPTLQSVLSRDRFLKLTVSSEPEHFQLKNKLVQLGLEFKCFNLKQDRPLKVLIRGLPSCTSKEAIGSAIAALGLKALADSATRKKLEFRRPPQAALQITPPTEAPLNKSADESIDFDQLLETVRLALPFKQLQLITTRRRKNFTVIAPPSATRIDPRINNRQNVIDFAILKNIPFLAKATVFYELSSDHLPCILDIETNTKPQSTQNLFVTNWNDYNYKLQHTNLNPFNINNEEDADKAIENLTKDMYAALNNSSNYKYLTKKERLPSNIKTLIKNKIILDGFGKEPGTQHSKSTSRNSKIK
ncbi:hypothetical protein CEXT_335661 [Caerostris extrusa]|uniref:Uncharacterized protein n=1 Tax=Caerostris extrusa TaxID=172846 RepID=A0AAV4RER2_CAEEX|nr:hypothetical protein CEXT_335661 [Caerostris extrusa]